MVRAMMVQGEANVAHVQELSGLGRVASREGVSKCLWGEGAGVNLGVGGGKGGSGERVEGVMHEQESGASGALVWIIGVLSRHEMPYQVVGGLAARAYGASRPLVDLDFYIPNDGFGRVLPEVRGHLRWGPAHYADAHWDITFAKLEYAGWRIELGAAEGAKIYDPRSGCWVEQRIDFSRSNWTSVLGQRVATIPRDDLVAYKSLLDREVDRQDLAEMGY